MIHTPPLNGSGKNCDDMMIAVDIAQLPFLKPHVRTIVLVSADGHFAPVIRAFRRNDRGRKVMVAHTGEVNSVLEETANECISLVDKEAQIQEVEIDLAAYVRKLQEKHQHLTLGFAACRAAAELPIKGDEAWQRLNQLLQKGVLEQYDHQNGEKQVQAIRLKERQKEIPEEDER